MPCYAVKLPNGTVALVKMARRKPKACIVCGRPASRLCDFPVAPGKTCDRALCAGCAVQDGPDRDYCPSHHDGFWTAS